MLQRKASLTVPQKEHGEKKIPGMLIYGLL